MPDRPASGRPVAVAIKDHADNETRPSIVARGYGAVAQQILELAFAAGVKVREDADLVEILEAIEVESEIPPFALATVAEILSHVYRANGQGPSEAEARVSSQLSSA